MKDIVKKLTDIYAQMERLLDEYTSVTETIFKIESEQTDKITAKINERDEIVNKLTQLKASATEHISSCDKETAEQIRTMLSGEGGNRRVITELVPLRESILNLRSAQTKALETDSALQKQFASRMEEAKEHLKSLNSDKKKLDYYSSLKHNNLGGSLDSSF